ncbi:aspartate/glutamate racemase family protein [Candidimonas humi]|uniref:Aspartate/glutamate racemase family protein n=1 Tax=Candidimonas humi TaxID=683355 RepID=A0ABV8NY96_9BURK|nr:aspartate/glutamate racemase family protein [Candidimonas humi]MBV6304784.1 aspartate/glutamate racemase family protein [Candidimonas humi]
MKIWHQSFTDLDVFPQYRATLQQHADRVMGEDASVHIHGLRPGTYPPGIAPMEMNSRAGLRLFNAQQVCEAALAAEAAGYDAFALGCFFDPALHEARSLVDIPVVSLTETCMLTACSLGRRFAVVALSDFQKMLSEDLAAQYGLASRLAGVVAMSPAVGLFDLESEGEKLESIRQRFRRACEQAFTLGAEVIIPGDGVLNEFLVRHDMLEVDGGVVMDSLGVLFQHAAFLARARAGGCLDVSRRLLYAKPTAPMMAHMRGQRGVLDAAERDFSGQPASGHAK